MKLPVLTGTIKRRLLVNYRAEPEVVQRLLPEPFHPKLHQGFAIAGICLIRMEHERPSGIPKMLGLASEHAAHRIAVEWTGPDGALHEGVYIPRRDTDSTIARLAGGRIFPVESQASKFKVTDDGRHVELAMRSLDGQVTVDVVGDEALYLPAGSCFDSMDEVSAFFQLGNVGYSPADCDGKFNAIELWTPSWQVGAFAVTKVHSSFFEDPELFPPGSIEFDNALVMRGVEHEWRALPDISSLHPVGS